MDRARRGTAAQRGYDARHRRWRLLILARDPLCRCDDPRCHAPSVIADHIVPLREWVRDPVAAAASLRLVRPGAEVLEAWSLDNGQGLSRACHARKSARER